MSAVSEIILKAVAEDIASGGMLSKQIEKKYPKSEPEIIRPGAMVVARPHPFSMETFRVEFPVGMNLREIVGPNAVAIRIEIGGMTIPEEMWVHVRPKPACAVVITRFPQGGSAKSIFRLIAFAALAVGVALISGGAGSAFITGLGDFINVSSQITAGLLAAAVGVVGSLAINALIPPSVGSAAGSESTNLLNSITGTSNQVNRYGPIPCVVGTILYFPTYAALPWTEVSGDDQYIRCLFDLGYGDPNPADMKIGDTDLASYTDVETEIGFNPSLFSQDILEESIALTIPPDATTEVRTTGTAADEVGMDLAFASGLFGIDADGKTTTVVVTALVEYAVAGSGSYSSIASASGLTLSTPAASTDGSGHLLIRNAERKAVRVGIRWKTASHQYDIRVRIVSIDWGGATTDNQIGTMTWSVLRTIRYTMPSKTGTKKLAMRIKATDQLSGSISQFNCILSQPIPVWHPDTSTWVTEYSSNPAWVFRWVLKDSPANPRRVDTSRIHDAELIAWGAECDAKGFCYSASLAPTTVYALAKEIAAAGRASFDIRDGKYSVIRDLEQTTPVQVFTPRNSSSFGGNRAFPDAVHALRVQFNNPEANYQQDERVVYDDGYGGQAEVAADSSLTLATNFEQLTLAGCTDPEAAWRLGRYHLAVSRLRPNTYTWSADVENLVCSRGDLVLVASDVIGVGLAWGKIKRLVLNDAGDATAVDVDESITPVAGTAYAVRFRRQDASVVIATLVFAQYSEGIKRLTFTSPISGLNPDDLFVFGEAGKDTIPLVVSRIDPGADYSAKISAVDASPAVLAADAGEVPAWSSQITGQPFLEPPPPPEISVVDSSQNLSLPNDAGNTDVTLLLTFDAFRSGRGDA